jgi:formylglycine-generating enzyme required for sulfatase activity
MDYLQSLEFQMAALQRKLRLLQDLRFFAETASPEELAGFGDELRSVITSSGASLGSVLAASLGVAGRRSDPATTPPPVAAQPPGVRPAISNATIASSPSIQKASDEANRSAETAPGSGESDGVTGSDASEALALVEPSMKPIPALSFVMGSEIDDTEKPPHKVNLGAFRMSDHLVTNKEYFLFVSAIPEWSKDRADPDLRDGRYLEDWGEGGYPEGKDDNPVAFVSFFAAQAFASWVGKRLPTEAEWECAARGGLVGKKYPGGDQMNDKLANLAKQYRGTTSAGKFEPNGFGLYDMAGNLFEWTTDWYGPYAPGETQNPKGPPEGEYKVVRGGSWMSGAGALRVSARVDMLPASCGQVGIRLADGG